MFCVPIDTIAAVSVIDVCLGAPSCAAESVRPRLSDSYRKCKVEYQGENMFQTVADVPRGNIFVKNRGRGIN